MKNIDNVLELLSEYTEECEFIAEHCIEGEYALLSDVIDDGLDWREAGGSVNYWLELAEALREYEWDHIGKKSFSDYSIM